MCTFSFFAFSTLVGSLGLARSYFYKVEATPLSSGNAIANVVFGKVAGVLTS